MTIAQAIARADAAIPNRMPHPEKLRHLSNLDGRIRREVIDRTADAPDTPFVPYEKREVDPAELLQTKLTVEEPYDDIYTHYLTAMIAHEEGEDLRYAECNAFFASLYAHFTVDYLRRHPVAKHGKFRY